ncbi:MAG: alpha/beta fold hydrolase [Gemmatimonadales bacterium]|nr:alpha/beta fold hydrolase [Gemmatimonadales bacterium]
MTPILLTVYPDECDAFGHLNQASFLSLFERARWEMLRAGPGMDLFDRTATWPAVRKTVIEYHAAAFPGDVLGFEQDLTHVGRTSFTMRQVARRARDDALVATAEFLFVCVNRQGRPVAVPQEFNEFMAARRRRAGEVHRLTVNGVSLEVEVRGDGPALIFIHGFPFERSIWAHQVAALDGWTRIAPDLRGMGHSDAPDLGYNMETYAADLAALLDLLGVDEVILVGHSMGGYIAFEFLRRWRDRVRGLVLVDSRAEPDTVEGKRNRDATAATAREQGAEALAETMLPKVLGTSTLDGEPATVERIRAMMAATPVSGIVGALGAMRDRQDSTPMLPGLAGVPTLVIVGDEDELTPAAQARAMADAIPGASLVVIRAAGHVPSVERSVETTDALLAFLESLP